MDREMLPTIDPYDLKRPGKPEKWEEEPAVILDNRLREGNNVEINNEKRRVH